MYLSVGKTGDSEKFSTKEFMANTLVKVFSISTKLWYKVYVVVQILLHVYKIIIYL